MLYKFSQKVYAIFQNSVIEIKYAYAFSHNFHVICRSIFSYSFQDVYSKGLITGRASNSIESGTSEKKFPPAPQTRYSPAEIQFFTSLSSFLLHFPILILTPRDAPAGELETSTPATAAQSPAWTAALVLLSGIFYHFQAISGYALLEHISPVTYR